MHEARGFTNILEDKTKIWRIVSGSEDIWFGSHSLKGVF